MKPRFFISHVTEYRITNDRQNLEQDLFENEFGLKNCPPTWRYAGAR